MATFDWWKNALKGDFGEFHDGDPQPGFYRNASKKYGDYPVAIWEDENDGMLAVKGFDERSCDADDIWTFVCRKPVEHDFYKAAIEAGKWPDEAPAPAAMGDNIPDDPAEALQMELDGQMEGLEAFLNEPITEQSQADKAATWSKNMADISKSADNQRKVEKQPSQDEGKAVDAKWNPIRDDAKTHSIDLKRHTDAWLLKQQHLERERQRKAHEEAERLRNEAAEAHRGANSTEAIEEASQKASDAEVAAQEADERKTRAGRTGASLSLRTYKEANITDFDKLLEALKDREEIQELVQSLANRAAKSGVELPGMEIKETQRAA